MKENLIIRASAGTGKTFSLATRFIRLMVFNRVDPKRIVALTFSRAAAKEIYVKLLERLWKAAQSEKGAAQEEALLKQGLSSRECAELARAHIDFSAARFAELLRQVIDSQEVGSIATLDSFILRIVKSFPLEMGFQHAVDVLDDFGAKKAVGHVSDEMLSADDPKDVLGKELAAHFKIAAKGEFNRACKGVFERIINSWHAFLEEHADAKNWTADSMCAALGVQVGEKPVDDGLTATGNNAKYFENFCDHLFYFKAGQEIFPKNKMGEMMYFFLEHPEETIWEYETGGTQRTQHKVCDCGKAGADFIRAGIKWMINATLRRQLEIAAAQLKLCTLFEGNYDVAARKRGQLTFTDFTNSQAFAEDSNSQLQLENIQFRFDERFDHWALDEFQDTSALQWKCLKRLVREAAAESGRSVMVVGDLKQSIYGWRGGDDAPFQEVLNEWPEFTGDAGESLENDVSYRYGENTVNFINRVFGPGNLRNSPVLGGRCADAIESWLDKACWMEHRADVDETGKPKANDYVEVIRVPKADGEEDESTQGDTGEEDQKGSASMKILAPKICVLVRELWQQHENTVSGKPSTDTIGILVRNNADGAYLAEQLRAIKDLAVVWEGLNGILEMPIIQATLELLNLAAHPGDTFSWVTVDKLLPLRAKVFPTLTTPEEVSHKVCEMLSRLGLSRTLRTIVSQLTTGEKTLSARSVNALETLVQLAVAFEAREKEPAESSNIRTFEDFLRVSAGRDCGESSRVIRILTIHRAKGLTIDHVIIPICESGSRDSIVKPNHHNLLSGKDWALELPHEDVALQNPILAKAWQEKADEHLKESLRLNYVALTRARKSTYVFVVDDNAGSAIQFRHLLLAPFTQEDVAKTSAPADDAVVQSPHAENVLPYGELVFRAGNPFQFSVKEKGESKQLPWKHRTGLAAINRHTPSNVGSAVSSTGAKSMAAFFSTKFGENAKRGIEVHAHYAQIEWLTPEEAESLPPAFRPAFIKPSREATCWREQKYEIFDGKTWESGQFDRVVFTGAGKNRAAIIYDFKTNQRHDNESEEMFVTRLNNLYAPQMESYRRAVQHLTGIPLKQITTQILIAPVAHD